jgi:hypothetical protein
MTTLHRTARPIMPQAIDTLNVALECLKAHPNWYLFPIRPLYKAPPCFKDELKLASNDPTQIRRWRAQNFGCNWGVALKKSKLIPVDVDRKPGKVGAESLDALELEHGVLPDTLIVQSPSGGLHIYFDEANGVTHQMRLNAFGKDIDSPNYTLIPGCVLCEDKDKDQFAGVYTIVNDAPVAPAPAWFKEYLGEKSTAPAADNQAPAVEQDTGDIVSRAIFYLQNDAKPSIQGQNGEFTMLMTAAVLKDMGLSQETSVELINEYYNVPGKCEPQWAMVEGPVADRLDMKVANTWSYLKDTQPGALSPVAEFGGDDAKIDEDDIVRMVAVYIANPGLPVKSNLDSAVVAASKNTRAEIAAQDTVAVDDTESDPMFADAEPEDVGSEEIKSVEPAQTLKLPPLDKIDWKAKPNSIEEVCKRWVWVIGMERFVNRREPTQQWKTTQFDSAFNAFLGKPTGSIAKELFKEGQLMRKFHYLAFRPGAEEVRNVEYNVWRPSGIVPAAGDTTVWNEHINYLFQNEDDANHVLNWMAWVLQNQNRKPNHALLLVGKNTGTGKSIIATIFEQLIGLKNTQRPKNSSMGGDFNSWLKDCRLCIIEEVYQVGRRENLNAMRDLITEARCEVNIKGIPAFTIENFVCVMGVSNHPDALPLDRYDRRWLVVQTFAERRERDYYEPLFNLARGIDKVGLAAIYAELLARDLTGYSALAAAPETEARAQMIEQSRDDAETWLTENAGNMPLARNVVQISDVISAMPANLQRTKRLMTTTVPNFLKDNLNGKKHPTQVWLGKRKAYLWVLHGKYDLIVNNKSLAAEYEKGLKEDRSEADTSAKADFED